MTWEVEQDFILAYKWTNLAALQKDKESKEYLEWLKNTMNNEQINAAKSLSNEWLEINSKEKREN